MVTDLEFGFSIRSKDEFRRAPGIVRVSDGFSGWFGKYVPNTRSICYLDAGGVSRDSAT